MARGPNEKNFSGDIPDGLADEVEDFITSHRDVKKKQLLAVALDLFLSLPEEAQAILAFTRRGDVRFQELIERVTRGLAENEALDIATATTQVKNAIVSYSILCDTDKTAVDEFIAAIQSLYAPDPADPPIIRGRKMVWPIILRQDLADEGVALMSDTADLPVVLSPVSVERATLAMKNAIQIYSRLPASDKKLIDDFLGGLDIIRQAGGVPAKASARGKSPKQSKSRRGSAGGA